MRPDFDTCNETFADYTAHISQNYTYNGSVRGIFTSLKPRPPLITVQGCEHLCGPGIQYYPWNDISTTITTWVLPVIGLTLQAPFESNENLATLLSLSRWIGNPVASISYVLWNIKIIGKCAMMVDMSTAYDQVPNEDSEFARMRDSMYILSVMNQYSLRRNIPIDAAEKLLRIALFSDDLPLSLDQHTPGLTEKRKKLATYLRTGRKKGAIPVFISLLWFLLALAISIQATFGQIGRNKAAHDLALGLLLTFLPIFILSCTVDRNAVAADQTRVKLNSLLNHSRHALLDGIIRETYRERINASEEYFNWTGVLSEQIFVDFFTHFAGQGRVRWHYGVAHPLLCSFENSFLAERGRGWLDDADSARTAMREHHRPDQHGLLWFDPRMVRQIASSICIVGGSTGSAFILSYYTPTVGLGCRSGGYMIYAVVTTWLFLIELACWAVMANDPVGPAWLKWVKNHAPGDPVLVLLRHFRSNLERTNSGQWTLKMRRNVKRILEGWAYSTFTGRIEVLLRLGEIFNAVWLTYIVAAQTIGSYQNCKCMVMRIWHCTLLDCFSSTWAGGGGYIDFENIKFYHALGVTYYWGAGTGLSCAVLFVGMVYIVAEYCTQSHLSTEEYQAASQGLLWTRRFKKRTVWFRKLLGLADTMASMAWRIVLFPFHAATGRKLRSPLSKSLVWDWKAKEGSAQSNQTRAASAQNFRRSDAVLVPLIDKDQDERSSRDSRTPDRSEVEEEQNLEHNVQGHDRVNVVAPSNRMATLQLPSEAHPRSH